MAAPKGNKFAVGIGRPPKYSTVDELEVLIDDYFESCFEDVPQYTKNGVYVRDMRMQIRPFTITGLCLALGTTRDLLLDYANDNSFSDTIARAKLKCHNYAEEHLYNGKNPQGAIFNLKNNYGWKDKSESEITGANGADFVIKIKRKSDDE